MQLPSLTVMSDITNPFEKHLFVCTSGEFCPMLDGNSKEIHQAFKEAVARAGLKGRVRVNNSGCLDQCGHGPNAVVYPEGVWYSHLTVEDVPVIVQEHLLEGRPVERLRYNAPRPGPNKLKRDVDRLRIPGQVDGCRPDWPVVPERERKGSE
ncbi:MAG TPA: (2Fe-2S) ferredoxin domain-containing protein [Blastocatellia bacterium]